MPTFWIRTVPLMAMLILTQACSAVPRYSVAEAFETSGLVPVKPYTRTIFSTENF